MNDERRGKLREIHATLARLELDVERILDKETDCIDNYPESLQSTERFEKMEYAAEQLEMAIDSICDAKSCIYMAIG